MAQYKLTKIADEKITAIYEYSLLKFGELQADSYFLGMHEKFEVLANHPLLGRESETFGQGIRQFAYLAHVIFYRPASHGVLIIDIFGMRQAMSATAEDDSRDSGDVIDSEPGMED